MFLTFPSRDRWTPSQEGRHLLSSLRTINQATKYKISTKYELAITRFHAWHLNTRNYNYVPLLSPATQTQNLFRSMVVLNIDTKSTFPSWEEEYVWEAGLLYRNQPGP